MKRFCLLIFSLIFSTCSINAQVISITPKDVITTCDKGFKVGNIYDFKDVKTGSIIKGTVLYYQPNGIFGQEAQIEIGNFRNDKGVYIPGKITIIPDNHKAFQEFLNYYSHVWCYFVRGSEVILKPDEHVFSINNTKQKTDCFTLVIEPAEEISTAKKYFEYGDYVKFSVVEDFYKSGKLYIKSGMDIYGLVEDAEENGWSFDSAELVFNKFVTKDVEGNKVTINSELVLDGFELLKFKDNKFKQFFNYIGIAFRGKEIDIKEVDKIKFNLLIK